MMWVTVGALRMRCEYPLRQDQIPASGLLPGLYTLCSRGPGSVGTIRWEKVYHAAHVGVQA